MSEMRNIVAYICAKYPHKNELSKARLTKLVYLSDWRSALVSGETVTSINWKFNHYGPYVDDVMDVVRSDKSFTVRGEVNMFGSPKETIYYNGSEPEVDGDDKKIIDFVISKTKNLTWDGFIKLVYSTYPVLVSEKQTYLDLSAIAARYKSERAGSEPVAA